MKREVTSVWVRRLTDDFIDQTSKVLNEVMDKGNTSLLA